MGPSLILVALSIYGMPGHEHLIQSQGRRHRRIERADHVGHRKTHELIAALRGQLRDPFPFSADDDGDRLPVIELAKVGLCGGIESHDPAARLLERLQRGWNARHARDRHMFDRSRRGARHRRCETSRAMASNHGAMTTDCCCGAENRSEILRVLNAIQHDQERHRIVRFAPLQNLFQRHEVVRRHGSDYALMAGALRESIEEGAWGALDADTLLARRLDDRNGSMSAFADPDFVDGSFSPQRFQDGMPPEDPVARIDGVMVVRRRVAARNAIDPIGASRPGARLGASPGTAFSVE